MKDSDFELRITQLAFPKGTEKAVRKEQYTDWATADRAFCLYRDLIKVPGSGILDVEFIEHRRELVHKTYNKDDAAHEAVTLKAIKAGEAA